LLLEQPDQDVLDVGPQGQEYLHGPGKARVKDAVLHQGGSAFGRPFPAGYLPARAGEW